MSPSKFNATMLIVLTTCLSLAARAQTPQDLVKQAVQAELAADRNDHSRWRYRDDERDKGTLSIVVQTDAGSVKRLVARNGQSLSASAAKAEDERIESLIHDESRLAKQHRDSAADDKSANELLTMLPDAFTWSVAGEHEDSIILHFEPNPRFTPQSLQARVLSAMRGDLVVDRSQHRIRTMRGTLTEDVTFGFGILGRMKQGGTFQVERREVAPRLWQITETHVHIDGKALLFKSIGQQQDEVQTDFHQVPGNTPLQQAAELSKPVH